MSETLTFTVGCQTWLWNVRVHLTLATEGVLNNETQECRLVLMQCECAVVSMQGVHVNGETRGQFVWIGRRKEETGKWFNEHNCHTLARYFLPRIPFFVSTFSYLYLIFFFLSLSVLISSLFFNLVLPTFFSHFCRLRSLLPLFRSSLPTLSCLLRFVLFKLFLLIF
jgi:hypothetical protein